jgi:hypothetical protein
MTGLLFASLLICGGGLLTAAIIAAIYFYLKERES